jgi:cell division protein FtsI (penicillin-binding protein 3)
MIQANPNTHAWRSRFITYSVFALWGVLVARLVHIQVFQSRELIAFATRQSQFEIQVPARPADIVDRYGKLLATTITSPSLFVDPSRLKVDDAFLTHLAMILGLDKNKLLDKLDRFKNKRFLWIKRRLTKIEIEQIAQLSWPDASHGFRDEFLRQYPQGHLASHVLGLRNIDGVGKGGVEESLSHLVEGQPGRRRLVRDALGRIVEVNFDPENEPRRFESVQLTIDLAIQMFAERELDNVVKEWSPESACAIVLDPRSGDVLAMASRPTYSPSDLSNIAADAWKNQAINIVYEPGSTFKPFVVAWALQQQCIKHDDVFFCEHKEYRMGNRILHDHHSYGDLSVTDILVKSSNIGMAKIGERLTNKGLHQAARVFGFGQPTGIDLPGELRGFLQPLEKWNGYSTGSIPMGHEIAVTPLQMIAAQASLSNGGRLITPRILKGVHGTRDDSTSGFFTSTDEPEVAQPARIVSPTVRPEVAEWIVTEPMTQVVERGTGTRAKLEGYSVFGKTGTAQKIDHVNGGYHQDRFVASFICGAPARNPQLLVLVVVNEPHGRSHGGGVVAAPAASRILQRTLSHLRIAPDRSARTAKR